MKRKKLIPISSFHNFLPNLQFRNNFLYTSFLYIQITLNVSFGFLKGLNLEWNIPIINFLKFFDRSISVRIERNGDWTDNSKIKKNDNFCPFRLASKLRIFLNFITIVKN
ncbi:hypothetical protein BpHYR1_047277 [Brachionus plicatilis]|uniref:Uncharacterized protein n=1 Tax=Brachionus plicatilis TaxID=10195 RepID=A0A3M7PUV9_BRAPC|nr:hypothetical protein BpHYR1_047277 [Brachionus plicatilis]